MDTKATYDRIATDWASRHANNTWWIAGTDHFSRMLPAGSRVLDMGCGAGDKTKYLKDKGLLAQGMDFSQAMIDMARKTFPGIEFGIQDLYKAGNITAKFDGIFLQAVLLHVPKKDVPSVLSQLHTLLKTSGLIYIAVKEQQPGKPEEIVLNEEYNGIKCQRFFSNFTMPELETSLAKAGMPVVWQNRVPGNTTHWLQVIGKKA